MRAKVAVAALAVLLGATAAADAAGPLYLYDAVNRIPYAYPGLVRVYTDLGTLGGMSTSQAQGSVAFAVGQWDGVATSSFNASVVGDVSLVGLGDITAANVADVIGADNGGGIHVVFDSDGSILRDVLGAPYGVLGVATPELVEEGSPAIYESWVIINGEVVPDPAATPEYDVVAEFTGVITHELGHAINLAHSQTNGAVAFFGDKPVPLSCDAGVVGLPGIADIETMYPYISPGQTGTAQSTVDILDDIVSLSNVYPSASWPAGRGSVAGTILLPDGTSPVMGVNVVARNLANPFADAVSALSGDYTQGVSGIDGRYRLNGLTPGAHYLLYVDGIVAGGFSTPHGLLGGPEEYYNGAGESGNSTLDNACTFEALTASAGQVLDASIAFNSNPDAPGFNVLAYPNTVVSKISQHGDEIVGSVVGDVVGFRWNKKRGYEFFSSQLAPVISGNGQTVGSTQFFGWSELSYAGFWTGGRDPSTTADDAWWHLPLLPGSAGCDSSLTSVWGLSRDASVAVGLDWKDCVEVVAVKWDLQKGLVQLPKSDPSFISSRANTVSDNGRVVAGHETMPDGFWAGVIWDEAGAHPLRQYADAWGTVGLFPVGDANGLSADGAVAVGENAIGPAEDSYPQSAWRWTKAGGLELLGFIPCPPFSWFCFGGSASAQAVSDDGSVIVGWGGDYFDREATIWTRGVGLMTLEEFLARQGVVSIDGWSLMTATDISGDGRVVAGWGIGSGAVHGWTVNIDKVKVCHGKSTIEVAFPNTMDVHLRHGDAFGVCGGE